MAQDFDPSKLDEGVRQLVIWLRSNGFNTTDSGDGKSKAGGEMKFLPFPHVVMVVSPRDLLAEADRLHCLVNDPNWQIEATYIPPSAAMIMLSHLSKEQIEEALK